MIKEHIDQIMSAFSCYEFENERDAQLQATVHVLMHQIAELTLALVGHEVTTRTNRDDIAAWIVKEMKALEAMDA